MRAVRFTKAELLHLREWFTSIEDAERDDPRALKLVKSIMAKLAEAEDGPKNTNAGPLEDALVGAARGKAVTLASGGTGYARASKVATQVKATPEDMQVIGAWLARQSWLRDPVTILTVLNKWSEWLPRARASQPPTPIQEGFTDGTASSGTTPASGGSGGRRRPPGFG